MAELKPEDTGAERKRIIAARNRVLGFALAGLAVLFFAITLAKMHH